MRPAPQYECPERHLDDTTNIIPHPLNPKQFDTKRQSGDDAAHSDNVASGRESDSDTERRMSADFANIEGLQSAPNGKVPLSRVWPIRFLGKPWAGGTVNAIFSANVSFRCRCEGEVLMLVLELVARESRARELLRSCWRVVPVLGESH